MTVLFLGILPPNWVCLLMGVKPIDTTKPKIGRRRDLLLLAASKENTGDLSQSSGSRNSKIGEVFCLFVCFLIGEPDICMFNHIKKISI